MHKMTIVLALASCLTTAAGAQQEPICVIDGTRRPLADCGLVGRAGGVPRDKIDRVDVLKGEAAAALYGRDAASSGVVSITTKPGGQQAGPGGEDPLARYFYPPELVMANQQAIDLSDRQRDAIVDAIKEAQGRFIDLNFRMSAEVERLQRLLKNTSVDEARVIDQLDRVLNVEREVKHAQLGLMIRIKNQLGPEQQAALDRLRQGQNANLKVF